MKNVQNFYSSHSGSGEIRCKTSPGFFWDTLYNHSIFLVGWLDWLIWFDLVCELYLLFQSTQLEWTPRILGIKREVYSYLFIPPKGKVIIPVQTLDFSDIVISLAYSKFLGLFLLSLGHLGPFHFHLGHLWAIPFSFGPCTGRTEDGAFDKSWVLSFNLSTSDLLFAYFRAKLLILQLHFLFICLFIGQIEIRKSYSSARIETST